MDLDELKKSQDKLFGKFFRNSFERRSRSEEEMLDSDESLHELATKELF